MTKRKTKIFFSKVYPKFFLIEDLESPKNEPAQETESNQQKEEKIIESKVINSGEIILPFPENSKNALMKEKEGKRLTFAQVKDKRDFYEAPEIKKALKYYNNQFKKPKEDVNKIIIESKDLKGLKMMIQEDELREMDTFGGVMTETEQVNELIADLQSFKNSKIFQDVEHRVDQEDYNKEEDDAKNEENSEELDSNENEKSAKEEQSSSSRSSDEEKSDSQIEESEKSEKEGPKNHPSEKNESSRTQSSKSSIKEEPKKPNTEEKSNQMEEESINPIQQMKMQVMEEKRKILTSTENIIEKSKIEFIRPTLVESELLLNQNSIGDIKDLVNTLGRKGQLTINELEGESFRRMSGQGQTVNSSRFDSGRELENWNLIDKDELNFQRKESAGQKQNVSNLPYLETEKEGQANSKGKFKECVVI